MAASKITSPAPLTLLRTPDVCMYIFAARRSVGLLCNYYPKSDDDRGGNCVQYGTKDGNSALGSRCSNTFGSHTVKVTYVSGR